MIQYIQNILISFYSSLILRYNIVKNYCIETVNNCNANLNDDDYDKSIEEINTENIIIFYEYIKNLFFLKKD